MGAKPSRSRAARSRPSGQHLLRSRLLAGELVANSALTSDDLVMEIGPGTGRLTEPLSRAAREVRAIEIDPVYFNSLRRRFASKMNVKLIYGDVLDQRLPTEPFRAFGNLPFGITTDVLRWLLDDHRSMLVRADLILQFEAARKRTSVWPSDLVSLSWLPWWEFHLERRLTAAAFEPVPSVDAAMMRITRRPSPLVATELGSAYRSLLRTGFRRAGIPIRRSLKGVVPERGWRSLARERGISPAAGARDLDVFDWVALFELIRARGPVRSRPSSR